MARNAVIDFSNWNNLPDYARAGYRSNEERWADFRREQEAFCYPGVLSFENAEHQKQFIANLKKGA